MMLLLVLTGIGVAPSVEMKGPRGRLRRWGELCILEKLVYHSRPVTRAPRGRVFFQTGLDIGRPPQAALHAATAHYAPFRPLGGSFGALALTHSTSALGGLALHRVAAGRARRALPRFTPPSGADAA